MQIGRYSIPEYQLPALIGYVQKLYEKCPKEEEIDPNIFAELTGHKSGKSGTFLMKLAAIRAYGLVEGRGKIRISEIGKHISHPLPTTNVFADVETALLNIPLWRELYSNFGGIKAELPKENFWADLVRITGAEAPEAQNKEKNVRKAYMEDVQYLSTKEKRGEKVEAPQGGLAPIGDTIIISHGKMELRIPADDLNALEEAKAILTMYIERKTSKPESKPEKKRKPSSP